MVAWSERAPGFGYMSTTHPIHPVIDADSTLVKSFFENLLVVTSESSGFERQTNAESFRPFRRTNKTVIPWCLGTVMLLENC